MSNPTAPQMSALELLGTLPPKTVAGLYMDAVDAYEFIKSEDSKGMARATMSGVLATMEVAMRNAGLEYSDLDCDDRGHPTGEKLEAKQAEWFETKRGWEG